MEKEFKKVRSPKDIILSSSLTAAGAILARLPASAAINVVGFLLVFAGITLLLVLKTRYKLAETGEIFRKKERFFAQSMKASIVKALESDPAGIDFKKENIGNGLRIDLYYNDKKVYCKVYEYVPYEYEACTPCFEYSAEAASCLIK